MKITCPACGGRAVQGFGFKSVYCLEECDKKIVAKPSPGHWPLQFSLHSGYPNSKNEIDYEGYRRANIHVVQFPMTVTFSEGVGGSGTVLACALWADGVLIMGWDIVPQVVCGNGVTPHLLLKERGYQL